MGWLNVRDRLIRPACESVLNPSVQVPWAMGLPPLGDTLLETIGRRRGSPGPHRSMDERE
jgi:hypothetical protein